MNLEIALASNREMGMAVSIIMSTHKMTAECSFERLRLVGMKTNRQLIDVSAGVVSTGALDLDRTTPSRRGTARPSGPARW